MELFDQNGCLTEEGLHAVIGGQLDERAGWKPPSTCPTATSAWTGTQPCSPPMYWKSRALRPRAVMSTIWGAADAEHLGPGRRSRCGGGAGADHVAHRHPGTDPVHRRNGAQLAA